MKVNRNPKYSWHSLSQHKWHSPRLHVAYWVADALSLVALAGGIVGLFVMRQPLIAVISVGVIVILYEVCSRIKKADKRAKAVGG